MGGDIVYFTMFSLTYKVNNKYEAQKYFDKFNMSLYVKIDLPEYSESVVDISWNMTSLIDGVIILRTNKELPRKALESISEWIKRECMSGFGIGFSNSDFAKQEDNENISSSFIYNNCSFPLVLMPPNIEANLESKLSI